MSPRQELPICNIAGSYWKMKKYDLAIEWANKAKSLDPNYVKIYTILSDSYFWLGEFQKSLENDLKEQELSQSCRVLRNIAIKYYKVKDNAKAREFINKALECNPKELRPHWTMGDILKSEGKYEQAIAEYKILENDETIQKDIWRQLAVCYNK